MRKPRAIKIRENWISMEEEDVTVGWCEIPMMFEEGIVMKDVTVKQARRIAKWFDNLANYKEKNNESSNSVS